MLDEYISRAGFLHSEGIPSLFEHCFLLRRVLTSQVERPNNLQRARAQLHRLAHDDAFRNAVNGVCFTCCTKMISIALQAELYVGVSPLAAASNK